MFFVISAAAETGLRAFREIDRTNELRRALNEHQRLALVPGMIAEGHCVCAGVEEFVEDRLGDTEAPGRVLAIDQHEIELPVAHQARQPFADNCTPRPADHVANK